MRFKGPTLLTAIVQNHPVGGGINKGTDSLSTDAGQLLMFAVPPSGLGHPYYLKPLLAWKKTWIMWSMTPSGASHCWCGPLTWGRYTRNRSYTYSRQSHLGVIWHGWVLQLCTSQGQYARRTWHWTQHDSRLSLNCTIITSHSANSFHLWIKVLSGHWQNTWNIQTCI